MATKLPKGQRWVTIKKEGPLHGRRILIDAKGFVVGGKLPKAMQGHHIGQLAGLKPHEGEGHYDQYSADELKEIHEDFKAHHAEMKKQLHEDLHGMAKHLRDQEAEGSDEMNLVREIRKRGGVSVPDTHDTAKDFKESIHPGVRKAISKQKGGMGLDQMADELGMNERDLLDKLSNIEPDKYTKIDDYHDKAKAQMPDYADRENAVNELGKHVDAIAAARKRKEHAAAKEKAEGKGKKEPAPKQEPQAEDPSGEAYDKLKQNYPEDSIGWAKGEGKWQKQDNVPLKDIDMNRRPGGRDMNKVNGIANDVKNGKKTDRVHLVKTPGGQKMKIADGYHRTLGNLKAGQKNIDAYVHNSEQDAGPWDKEIHDKKLNLSDAEQAKKEEKNSGKLAANDAQTAPPDQGNGKTAEVKRRGDKLDVLHDDVQNYMDGKTDANDLLSKHHRLIGAMARNVAEKRGGDAEDLKQEGMTAAYKTLEALKNGTQKPKAGQHLGEHLLKRVKQGLSEGARQGNERPLSRESSKLAALVNSHKQAHVNATGQEPSEDELYNRVAKDDKFKQAKFAAPGTKTNIEDPREKFNALRDAMKNQKSQATLDEAQTDDEGGNMGTKGGQIADQNPENNPEHAALRKEAEAELQAKKDKLHQTLGEFGLTPGERHAVVHRFGVGHKDVTGAVVPWDKVAEHMTKDLGRQVKPETARKQFNDGRAKLHPHIGDERMGMLMEKSLLADPGVHLLLKHLYELGLYDILKSHGLEDADVLEPVIVETRTEASFPELIKSLAVNEYIEDGWYKRWADGSVTASIIKYRIRGTA